MRLFTNLFRCLHRLKRLLILGLICLGLLGACSPTLLQGNWGGTRGATSSRVVLGTTAKVRTLDPADAYEVFSSTLLYNLGERLYRYKPGTTELEPQLATALPTISSDGLTYKIPLRKGVLFHDGSRFDAKAMAFSLQRFIDNGGQPASLLAGRVAKITAIGDYELEIQLKKPFVAFPSLLAFSGLCAVSPQAYEMGAGKFKTDTFVGTGPYKLTQYRTDSLRLEPFAQYWGPKPQNQGIDVQRFSSGVNLYNAFRSGVVDIATQSLQPAQIQALQQQSQQHGWQVITGASNVINLLTVNLRQPPWDQLPARQALAALLNRQVLQTRVFQGLADPLFSLIPTIFSVSQPVFKSHYGDGQPNRGRALLQAAGYTPSRPLPVELWYRSNVPSNVLAAMTLKAVMERDWGQQVRVKLNSVESTTAYQNLDKGVYPLFILDWYGDFYDPDNYIEPFLACDEGSTAAGCKSGSSALWGSFFYNQTANQLIDQERREADPQKRQQLFTQLQRILVDEVPFIPLWQSKSYAFAQAEISGVQLEPTQQFGFWTIQKKTIQKP